MQLRSAKTKDGGIVVTTIDILTPRTPSWGEAMRSKDSRNKLEIYFSVKHNCRKHMDFPQFHILKPAHFVQPQHFKLYLYYPMISSICSTCSSPGQASGLSTGVPPGGQSAVSLSPMTYLSIKNHKKPGSSEHFLFHRKTITNLKVAVNLLHLASLNCFDHFRNDFSCYRGNLFHRCSRFKPFNPPG